MDRIQSVLALDFLDGRLVDVDGPYKSLGRVGILGCFLGVVWGIHVSCGVFLLWVHFSNVGEQFFLGPRRLAMAWTWCFYIASMCTFHLMEFFVTAFFNPKVVASDSFLVNHSKAYTVAAIVASTEFWVRFCFGTTATTITSTPNDIAWTAITLTGMVMVITSQIVRSCAMMQCGESFNHYIQTSRKDNHVLVTGGIYKWFRHPSYMGFYYWSIGTQLVLHNPLSGGLFAIAGWKFFSQRIPYEEKSLIRLFGDQYYDYVMRSYVGIPCIPSIPADESGPLEDVSTGHGKSD
jgi:protein-S-isoprenylcysteine O-methyltransferase